MGGFMSWFDSKPKPGFNSQPLSFNTNTLHGYKNAPNNAIKPSVFGAFSNMLNNGHVSKTKKRLNKYRSPYSPSPKKVTNTIKTKNNHVRGLFPNL